jgi:hypothetical protein
LIRVSRVRRKEQGEADEDQDIPSGLDGRDEVVQVECSVREFSVDDELDNEGDQDHDAGADCDAQRQDGLPDPVQAIDRVLRDALKAVGDVAETASGKTFLDSILESIERVDDTLGV